MTQQQIAYYNAQTQRRQLDFSKAQAEAAMIQAKASKQRADTEESSLDATIGTSMMATIGGLILLALL